MIELLFAVVLTARPLASPEALEPSVRNEVLHALRRAPTNTPSATALPVATNGLTRTEVAIALVSAQQADGRWRSGTNDVTAAAVKALRALVPVRR